MSSASQGHGTVGSSSLRSDPLALSPPLEMRIVEWPGEYDVRIFSPQVKRRGLFGRTVWKELTRCRSLAEARAYLRQYSAGDFKTKFHPFAPTPTDGPGEGQDGQLRDANQ